VGVRCLFLVKAIVIKLAIWAGTRAVSGEEYAAHALAHLNNVDYKMYFAE
jgi:hypothetical protein